jgi:uracil-DNA glycosylase family 4
VDNEKELRIISEEITACRKCRRLVLHREMMARDRRRAYREWTYWGRGVPGFGDAQAELFVLGLAPGAHGSNRTGRMFTGDRSGEFLYAALHRAGFANQADSFDRNDGLRLENAYISAAARCAPPENKPLPDELANCRGYLQRELEILRPKVVLALGKLAWDTYLRILKDQGVIESRAKYAFAHGRQVPFAAVQVLLVGVYHPSQQNTQTGKLTPRMYSGVLDQIRQYLKNRRSPIAEAPRLTDKPNASGA